MWKTFASDGNPYMLKISNANGIYSISLSDLIDIWYDEYAEGEIVNKLHECNPSLVIETEEAILQVTKIFNHIDEAHVVINKFDHKVDINIKTEQSGINDTKFAIKYALQLAKTCNKKFTEEITAPMIHTINYLQNQQQKLCDLILKKDRELEEYKMEKGDISRSDLITEKFDSDILERTNEKLMLNIYNDSNKFWDSFISEFGNCETKTLEINVNPWNHIKKKRKVYSKASAKKPGQSTFGTFGSAN